MHAKDLIIDNCSDGEVIKDFGEGSPDIERAVFSDTLIIETVNLRDEPRLVISSEQGDSVLVSDLEREQHEESFDAVPSPIDIIPEEDVIGIGRISSNLEELKQIVELPMNIPADGHR